MIDITLKMKLDHIIDNVVFINESDLIKQLSNVPSYTDVDLPDIIQYLQDNCVEVIYDKPVSKKSIDKETLLNNQLNNENVQWYLNNISQYKRLSVQEEFALCRRIKLLNDQKAKEELINSSLYYVVDIAKNYVVDGIEFMDLIQAGNIGLMYAVDRFDYSKDIRFQTCAYLPIMQHIFRFIQHNSSNINIPTYLYERAYTFTKISNDYFEQYGCYPDKAYIVEIYNILEADKKAPAYITEETYDKIYNLILNNDNSYIHDIALCDTNHITDSNIIDNYLETDFLNEELSSILESLISRYIKNEKKVDILKMRYGLAPYNKEHTLQEIGNKYHVGRERIRQIVDKSLKMLNTYRTKEILKDFY